MTRIGLFGGAFDPIHLAHIHLANHALETLSLDKVLIMPSGGQPYYKFSHQPVPPEHRLAMIEVAIADHPRLAVSDFEIAQEKFCYTIDTLRYLKSVYPSPTEIVLLAGEDWRKKVPEWKDGMQLLREFKVAFFVRPGVEAYRNDKADDESGAVIDMPEMDISSTMIRERIQSGQDIQELVPKAVYDYIQQHGLYKAVTSDE